MNCSEIAEIAHASRTLFSTYIVVESQSLSPMTQFFVVPRLYFVSSPSRMASRSLVCEQTRTARNREALRSFSRLSTSHKSVINCFGRHRSTRQTDRSFLSFQISSHLQHSSMFCKFAFLTSASDDNKNGIRREAGDSLVSFGKANTSSSVSFVCRARLPSFRSGNKNKNHFQRQYSSREYKKR